MGSSVIGPASAAPELPPLEELVPEPDPELEPDPEPEPDPEELEPDPEVEPDPELVELLAPPLLVELPPPLPLPLEDVPFPLDPPLELPAVASGPPVTVATCPSCEQPAMKARAVVTKSALRAVFMSRLTTVETGQAQP
jgi:protein TonB